MPKILAYPVSNLSTVEIAYGRVFISSYSETGPQSDLWDDIGELDAFKSNVESTKKELWGKGQPTSRRLLTVATRVKETYTFKCYEKTKLLRGLSMLGAAKEVTQAAVADGVYETTATAGKFVFIPNVLNVTITGVYEDDGVTELPDGLFAVTDTAFASGKWSADLGAYDGETVKIKYTAPALTTWRIVSSVNPIIDVRAKFRAVNAVGQKGILDIHRLRINPNGDQNWISDNDEMGMSEFQGEALDVTITDPLIGETVTCPAFFTPDSQAD